MIPDVQPDRIVSNEVLYTHLSYVERDLNRVLEALPNMATKQDIKDLENRMSTFATKEELRSLEGRLARDGVHKTLSRWNHALLNAAAAITAIATIGGVIITVVHFWDKLQ